MTPEELCAKAADVVEEHGLNKDGSYYDPNSQCWCTIGALAHAYDGRNQPFDGSKATTDEFSLWMNEVFEKALVMVAEAAGLEEYSDIPDWNDHHATKDQVVQTLRLAAHRTDG